MSYVTNTRVAALQNTINRWVKEVPGWIDIPKTLEEVRQHTDVLTVLHGQLDATRILSLSDQVKLALKVANSSRLILEEHIEDGVEMKLWPQAVAKSAFDYFMLIPPEIAFLALRNAWGRESDNTSRPYHGFNFIRFGTRNWTPLFLKIRRECFD